LTAVSKKNGVDSTNVTSTQVRYHKSCGQTKAMISFLGMIITKKNFKRLGREFIFTWSKIMNKSDTTKDMERDNIQVWL